MLNWNAEKVKNLNGKEIWLFIIARVLIGIGLGALLAIYVPQVSLTTAISSLVIGTVLFLVALKGLIRKRAN
jgi:uncharacterized membrane protein YfcA